MATQKCPRCGSDRIRHAYRRTSIIKKITLRYNLLCDDCNWEFVGFAIPGMVPNKTKKRKNSSTSELRDFPADSPENLSNNLEQPSAIEEKSTVVRKKVRKKVKLFENN